MAAAVLFFSHVFDRISARHLAKLKRETSGYGTFFLYADARSCPLPSRRSDVVTFDFQDVQRRYRSASGRTLLPGNCHLVFLEFFRRFPEFDYYWIVEYDVAFTGHWRDFFSAFDGIDADLIASHLRDHDAEPGWLHWHTLWTPPGAPAPRALVRAFCPVQRLSRRALDLIGRRVAEGWSGHFEALVPTILRSEGYRVVDIGGDGPYVLAGFRNRFYTSLSGPDGRLRIGTMRFRPPILSLALARPDTLYHPVKSWPRSRKAAGRLMMDVLKKVSYVGRHLARSPGGFGRALARTAAAEIAKPARGGGGATMHP